MNFNGTRQLPAPRQEVWRLLHDVETLRHCIPGCDALTQVDADTYHAVVAASVGPVRAKFKGTLIRSDVKEPTGFSLVGQGQGGIAGFGKMKAQVALEEADGATLLHFNSEANVGGKLAQVGSRLIAAAAERFNADFFDRLERRIADGSAPALAGPAHAAPAQMAQMAQEVQTAVKAGQARGAMRRLLDRLGFHARAYAPAPGALQRSAAEIEICGLLNRYCHLIDRQSFDELGSLFTFNGELDLNGTPVKGPAAIANFMRGRTKGRSLHVPAGYVVVFVDDSHAEVNSSVLVFRGGSGGESLPFASTVPGAAATYQDQLELENGHWRIRVRKAKLFMVVA